MPSRVRARVKGVKGYISAMRPGWLGNPYPVEEYKDLDQNLRTACSFWNHLCHSYGVSGLFQMDRKLPER